MDGWIIEVSAAILKRLGLTAADIARHVVRIEPPLRPWNNKTRAHYMAQGLTALGRTRKRASVERGAVVE